MIQSGQRVTWSDVPLRCRRSLRLGYRYRDVVTVLDVHPHTARIRVHRYDGKTSVRWVKLNRLWGAQPWG